MFTRRSALYAVVCCGDPSAHRLRPSHLWQAVHIALQILARVADARDTGYPFSMSTLVESGSKLHMARPVIMITGCISTITLICVSSIQLYAIRRIFTPPSRRYNYSREPDKCLSKCTLYNYAVAVSQYTLAPDQYEQLQWVEELNIHIRKKSGRPLVAGGLVQRTGKRIPLS